jgi:hypothetical protein
MMTCSPLTIPESLKLLIREGMSKLCLPGLVPVTYEAFQFFLTPGEPGTNGQYLLVGLQVTLGARMRVCDVLLSQLDLAKESPPNT